MPYTTMTFSLHTELPNSKDILLPWPASKRIFSIHAWLTATKVCSSKTQLQREISLHQSARMLYLAWHLQCEHSSVIPKAYHKATNQRVSTVTMTASKWILSRHTNLPTSEFYRLKYSHLVKSATSNPSSIHL